MSKQAVTSGEGVPYNAYAHSFAGMGVQFILFMGIEMGVGLLLQRQRRPVAAAARRAALARRAARQPRRRARRVLSLFILCCLFLFARLVFGVRIEGSLVGFLGDLLRRSR